MAAMKDGDTVSSSWTFCFFDCAAPEMDEGERAEHRKSAMRIGVEREMTVLYQQPHLVPPMKLTLYDRMPPTPTPLPPSQLSKVLSQGRNLASRASQRASFSMRKRASSRPTISNPIERVPSARRYRPLELSIYAPQNRLSDLPEFDSDAVEFTDDGAIQLPPRALIKAKSQEFKRTPSQRDPSKSQSMIEPSFLHRRTDTTSTVISTSRPASHYEALRSHPVSWHENALPGLAPQCHHRNPALAGTLLSPMQEEFTPACTPACITIDGTLLEFPKIDPEPRATSPDHESAPAPEITPQIVSTTVSKKITIPPFKLSRPPTSSSATMRISQEQQQPSPTMPDHQTSPSISSVYSSSTNATSPAWHQRGPSSSAASINTTRSFAEHRRKRSEFYQVRIPKVPTAVNTTSPTRVPSTRIPFTQQFKPSYARSRARTNGSVSTVGSASTVNTDVLSFDDDDGDAESMTTMSTTHVVQDVRCPSSRSARAETARRAVMNKHNAIVVTEEEVQEVFVQEIGRPMPSPGVGLAF